MARFFLSFLLFLPLAACSLPDIPLGEISEKTFALVNAERTKAGLPPLKKENRLERIALRHSEKMASEGRLSHRFPDYPELRERLFAEGLTFTAFAENVALSSERSPERVHQGFMDSPSHRANLLNPSYNAIGVGVSLDGEGDLYITEIFLALTPSP
ncbi:MAG TPA: CAP domain-containing protein [Candidatus Aminicenantes bacterium]|nr:CAP domain-containing protein [Candidatus Aminicenantes bacterium]HPT00657.1 CAP domain-containing protein [Candidatus Aminicenantes bacterium]